MITNELAIILLASGLSQRFGPDDKLLADLNGKPLGSYAANLFATERTELHCAVVPSQAPRRAELFSAKGWTVLKNSSPELGQGSSLAIAAKHLQSTEATAALILLADMPFISEAYLQAFVDAAPPEHAAMSEVGSVLQPPALFPRSAFPALAKSAGDKGARAIFKLLPKTTVHAIAPAMARDIDTTAALARAEESFLHA